MCVYHLKSYTNSSTGCVILSLLVIFLLILIFGARSICVDDIPKRVYKMKMRSMTFFFFVWTKFNLNTPFPRFRFCGKIKHRNARAGEFQNRLNVLG
jgi:hypothetical protein